ncbi:MAG: hypothetical protein KGL75_08530 [Acidobacteriota bacterium]|nr:hypothetical protein [Acidobacteriota bacterium]
MTERRAIEAALKSLYPKDGARQAHPPAKSKERAKRSRSAAPQRHDRRCCVCRHRRRAEIESEFLRWRSAESIAKEYGIAHHSSIYRHAHANGLFAERATHLRLALSPIIEQAAVVPVTADSIIRAVALCARLTDDGEWINPPKRVIHHSATQDSSRPFPKARRDSAFQESASPEPSVAAQHAASEIPGPPSSRNDSNPNSENAAITT